MICDPMFEVLCDRPGCDVNDHYEGTALAGGGYDTRNIPRAMERNGWRIEGDKHVCPECVEVEAELAEP